MSLKILTKRSCIVSAKLLRDALSNILGRRILVTTDADKVRGKFIRYGSADPVRGMDTKHNSAEFVKLVSNKANFAKKMLDNGIYSPVYRKDGAPQNYPVIIRKTLTGSGGSGIVVCKDAETFNQHWDDSYVWTPFIKTQFELRVHVLGGKVVKIMKKIHTGEGQDENAAPIPEPALPIRNLQRGYHYSARKLSVYPNITSLVDKLKPILQGSFYTLDVGWDKVNQAYFVFEANSGSGLNTQTVDLYADYLAREFYQE